MDLMHACVNAVDGTAYPRLMIGKLRDYYISFFFGEGAIIDII